ncbi:Basic-leucine zipper domain containing protein [Trema orientale]|uniref:Basic-leucine zipper domain containing protein n=1 Tax=Trema orientale TaxID=63057 RepID=A0A2P5FLU3_TREOI|nr:Basic-leucine zipper domain containing protein [Trema orientale]
MADASPRTDISTDVDTDDKNQRFDTGQYGVTVASDSSDRSKDKTDQKTLRRLAQNREAARKSRLRKKAYVQQLESSRLKLTQLEQELQRARQQGIFISSSGDQAHSLSGNGNIFFEICKLVPVTLASSSLDRQYFSHHFRRLRSYLSLLNPNLLQAEQVYNLKILPLHQDSRAGIATSTFRFMMYLSFNSPESNS